ncbi:MAG TPA: hypothetical protein VHL59_08725, partial [Thermoanaerobaculia bacterium]|nr:hypothetical protein [Thermoanaerobaculia bacterium]
MRLTPEQFQQIYWIFVTLILCFMAFVGVRIAMFEHRRRHPDPPRPRRRPGSGGSGTYRPLTKDDRPEGTFGTSGIGASDVAGIGGASIVTSSSDVADASFDSGGGSDSSGGGDS